MFTHADAIQKKKKKNRKNSSFRQSLWNWKLVQNQQKLRNHNQDT